ncbi:hypothetical protein BC830DRAFT_1171402 [Chytriomyces sp. MP71]|nr:hypothetical protein BC830DRAFT_1171402 [Chytriomyces sp. MP71]
MEVSREWHLDNSSYSPSASLTSGQIPDFSTFCKLKDGSSPEKRAETCVSSSRLQEKDDLPFHPNLFQVNRKTCPSLQNLPTEILDQIAGFVEAKSIFNLAQSTRRCRHLALPILNACHDVKDALNLPWTRLWPVFEFPFTEEEHEMTGAPYFTSVTIPPKQETVVAHLIRLLDKHRGSVKLRIPSIRFLTQSRHLLTKRIQLEVHPYDDESRYITPLFSVLAEYQFVVTKLDYQTDFAALPYTEVFFLEQATNLAQIEEMHIHCNVKRPLSRIKGLTKLTVSDPFHFDASVLTSCASLQELHLLNVRYNMYSRPFELVESVIGVLEETNLREVSLQFFFAPSNVKEIMLGLVAKHLDSGRWTLDTCSEVDAVFRLMRKPCL